MNTAPLCAHCGRPVLFNGRMAGMLMYHYECTLSTNAQTFTPPPMTADLLRLIVREEVGKLLASLPPMSGLSGEGEGDR